jgi:hypothetical protein
LKENLVIFPKSEIPYLKSEIPKSLNAIKKPDFRFQKRFKLSLNLAEIRNQKSEIEKCGITFQGNICLLIKSIEP